MDLLMKHTIKMKVKALSRSQSSTTRSSLHDLRPTHKNLNPSSHPQADNGEHEIFNHPFFGEIDWDALENKEVQREGVAVVGLGNRWLLLASEMRGCGWFREWAAVVGPERAPVVGP